MGLLKGTVSFSLYRLEGSLPASADEFIHQQLRAFAFRSSAPASEEKAIGWTSLENVLDTDFEGAKYIWGDYLMLTLRIDRKTVPPPFSESVFWKRSRISFLKRGRREFTASSGKTSGRGFIWNCSARPSRFPPFMNSAGPCRRNR